MLSSCWEIILCLLCWFSLLLTTVTWPGWMPVTVIFLSGLIRVTPLTTLGGLGMRTDMRLGRSTLSMAAATLLRRNISWNSQVFSILIIFIPRFWSLTRWGWSTKDKSRIFAEVNMICFAIRFRDLMIWHSIVCDFQWFNKWMKLQRHLNKFQASKLTIKDIVYANQKHSYICLLHKSLSIFKVKIMIKKTVKYKNSAIQKNISEIVCSLVLAIKQMNTLHLTLFLMGHFFRTPIMLKEHSRPLNGCESPCNHNHH